MLQQPERRRTASRTIASAIIMLIGIVTLGIGFVRNETTLLIVGVMVALAGVMTEVIGRVTAGR